MTLPSPNLIHSLDAAQLNRLGPLPKTKFRAVATVSTILTLAPQTVHVREAFYPADHTIEDYRRLTTTELRAQGYRVHRLTVIQSREVV